MKAKKKEKKKANEETASKLDAKVSQKRKADVTSMCNDKGTNADGMIKRAFRALQNMAYILIYDILFSYTYVNNKNLAGDEFSMKGARKDKYELANNEIIPGIEVVTDIRKAFNWLRKKLPTKSSVFTSPNKVTLEAYDIDSCDAHNQFAHAEYVEDLYKFYKIAEESCQIRDYMNYQVEINEEMRANLSYLLIDVHEEYQLMPETLYLAFQIMDRYLSAQTVKRRKLQLIGLTSMFIASKYVEIRGSQNVAELAYMFKMSCSRSRISQMEKEILNKLDWSLTVPTMYVFLVRFLKAASGDKQMEQMAFFFSELALMNYTMITYKPSMVAASAVYVARCNLNIMPLWTKTLEYHTGFKSYQLVNCAAKLRSFHKSEAADKMVKVKKHSRMHYDTKVHNTPLLKILKIIMSILARLLEKMLE